MNTPCLRSGSPSPGLLPALPQDAHTRRSPAARPLSCREEGTSALPRDFNMDRRRVSVVGS
jgi:hypothetical protein